MSLDAKKKRHLAILCGGQSAEHEVSLESARNVTAALDPDHYEVTLIAIDKKGHWHLANTRQLLKSTAAPTLSLDDALTHSTALAMIPGQRTTALYDPLRQETLPPIDVVFPILHGPCGEDGSAQGLLKLANLPYVGADVLGSAVGMDKDVMKRLLRDADIPIAPFLVFHRHELENMSFDHIVNTLGLPFFVKPANLGSSVGISKVTEQKTFSTAIRNAFAYDHKIIIEQSIVGREIECAILGNDNPQASVLGEIIPHHEFYSYEAKYLDAHGADLQIPAKLPEDIAARIQTLAIQTFKTLGCAGMARVDFFLTPDHRIFVNEINTIPGFTSISMYPQLWAASGIPYPALINHLIDLALERFSRDQQLTTTFHTHEVGCGCDS